jgi:hypothetical protein
MSVSLLKIRDRIVGNIWVCQCCMLVHANGECCADDNHGGDGIEPWRVIDGTDYTVTMGLLYEEHDEDCEVFKLRRWPDDYECECERNSFSSSQCDGCGSWLAGERHAFTLWLD